MLEETRKSDPELADLVEKEFFRQEHHIEMIASESVVPLPVMELSGSIFTNKTLEGLPGKRYQAGAQVADQLERMACARAKELFGADHVNIQTYSGTTANYSVFAAVLKPGDRVLGMRLDQGGHLSHGSPANWVSRMFRFDFYGLDPVTEQIDYEEFERKVREFRPKLIIAGASSYPRLIDYERMAYAAKKADALFLVDMAHIAGLVAAGVIPSPVPYADFVSSSTTKTFCSARSGMVLCKEPYARALDRGTFPGSIGSLHLTTMAAKCWSFRYAATPEFRKIMEQVVINAGKLAEELAGCGFRIVSGGTDNHLLLVDLRSKHLTGQEFQDALDAEGISVNKNMIPFDPEKPSVTSGVRIGLTAVAQRGMKEPEMHEIASIMDDTANHIGNPEAAEQCRRRVEKLIRRFPLYHR